MLTLPEQPDQREEVWDQKEMSFTEHLRELRKRLLIAIVTVIALAAVTFVPMPWIIDYLKGRYFGNVQLHAFGPADVIFAEVKFSIYGGIVLGLPVLLYQLWMFVVPAFHPRTRRMVYKFVGPSFLLALAGIAFAHFLVLPHVVGSLLAITNNVATPTFGVESTLNFVFLIMAAFALIFQTPVVMVALARIGLVNSAFLKKNRRYFFFAFVVFGGVISPDGNPLTMAMMSLPMYALYEIGIWIIAPLERSWRAQAA